MLVREKQLFDKSGTFSGMCALLELCGVNLKEFERLSLKSLEDLWGEIERHEIHLLFDLEGKKITRVARSVRLLITHPDGGCFLETKRMYLARDIELIRKIRPWTVSGTCLREINPKNPEAPPMPEDPLQTVIRETKEELYLDIPIEEIESLSVADEEDRHPSSVYHSFESHVFFRRYRWSAKQSLRKKMYAAKDNGVIAYVEYFNRWPRGLQEWTQSN